MSDLRRNLLICSLLALLVTVVFWQVVSFEFINFDDPIYVTENSHIQKGLTRETMQWAFSTHLHGHYHPLTWLSHAADAEWFGLDPAGHHFSGFLLHLINTLLLFMTLVKMTGAPWPSGFTAALFAVHPLHIEPVAWVADRKDLLFGFFWILSLRIHAAVAGRRSAWLLLLLLLTYLLGLLAKTMMITLPLVLLLLDFWPLRRFGKTDQAAGSNGLSAATPAKILLEKAALLPIAGLFVLLTTGAMHDLRVEAKTLSPHWQYDFLPFLLHYLEKFVWPVRLTVLYPYAENPSLAVVVLGAAALVAITVTTYLARRRLPFLLTGWLWFLLSLLPVAGIIHGGPHRVADRYTYIPLIGLFIALAWTWTSLGNRSRKWRPVLVSAACLLLAVFSVLSFHQTGRWRSSISLFEHAVSIFPDNWVAHNNLADALDRQGNKQAALDHYLEALRLNPDYAKANYNLGNTLASLGRQEEALRYYLAALASFPGFAEAHNNAGVLLVRKKNYPEARDHFAAALALEPDYADAQNNLRDLTTLLQDLAERIDAARKQLAAEPDNGELYNTLGLLYREGGDPTRAEHQFREALRLNPDFAGAHNNLGILFAEHGDLVRATEHFQRAVDLDSDFAGARINLERARAAALEKNKP